MKIDKSVEEIDRCIICVESVVSSDARFSALLGLIPPYDVKVCASCALRWLSPRPTATGYRELYSYENYFDGKESVEYYPALAAERRPYFARRIRRIEKFLIPLGPLSILDIGAATGEFVHEAGRRGHIATGIELSAGARQAAKQNYGLELLGISIEELDGAAMYDVIHMNHVFEHLPYPVETLAACYKHLNRGGLLVLEVPQQLDNDLDRLKRILGVAKHPRFNAYSLHHTYFFVPSTISMLLMKQKFRITRLATSNPARTPVIPFNGVNALLTVFLWLSDVTHHGGNIIELFAIRDD
jgi:2-polyprenyl-3-methyl-5-hydroxy-6-metoxy-1,4-benzoquinol methylase